MIAASTFGTQAMAKLQHLADLVTAENVRQNLVSAASIPAIWVRHIVDSVQLVSLAPQQGLWVDVGTGAGFPGLAVAIVRPEPIWLIEPRRRRADFLTDCARAIGLDHVVVLQKKAEVVRGEAAVVSARAVAPIDALFTMCEGFASRATRFVFPRGRNAGIELASVNRRGVFHVKQSMTDPDAGIVIADQVAFR